MLHTLSFIQIQISTSRKVQTSNLKLHPGSQELIETSSIILRRIRRRYIPRHHTYIVYQALDQFEIFVWFTPGSSHSLISQCSCWDFDFEFVFFLGAAYALCDWKWISWLACMLCIEVGVGEGGEGKWEKREERKEKHTFAAIDCVTCVKSTW